MPTNRARIVSAQWPLLVVVVAVLPYLQTLTHGFVFDDVTEVVRNVHIRSPENLGTIFTSTAWAGAGTDNYLYRPLTTLSFAVNHALGGYVPWGYHLVNILLHATVCLLLYRLAPYWGLSRRVACAAALLFAVHPVHVEAVANVAGRKDVMATMFVLLALHAHRLALHRGGPWMLGPAAAVALAFLSKETGAVAIGLMFIQDVLTGTPAGRARRAFAYGSTVVVLGALLSVRTTVLGGFAIADIPFVDNPLAHAPVGTRLVTATVVLGRGLGLLVFPGTLSPDYSYNTIPVLDSPAAPWFLVALTALTLLAATAFLARKTAPIVAFCAVWYVLGIAPAANILLPVGTMFAERLLYLPSVAVCIAAALLFWRFPRPAALVLLGLATASLGARTFSYAAVWESDATVFAAASQASAKVHYNRAILRKADGDSGAALSAYDRAIEIHPRYAKAHANRGNLRWELGDKAGALTDLNEALRLDPNDAIALNNRGLVYRESGRHKLAIADLTKAIRLRPQDPLAYVNRGLAFEAMGDNGRAVQDYRTALRLGPETWRHRSFAKEQLRRASGHLPESR
jgi:tetratricopeptide (TPR) repeat protein